MRCTAANLHSERSEDPVDHRGQRRFAEPAKRERGERDPQLRPRDVAVEMRERLLHRSRERITRRNHVVDLATARADERELRSNKESVGQHEQEHNAQSQSD
jgi:hypothetical protein